jgi:PAT family beta-lactamase induction signal transducer AmpG
MEAESVWRKIFSKRMLTVLLLGYAAGLPYLLSSLTLQAWMTREGVDLKVLGFVSVLGTPYSIKFLWAPFLDRFQLPFLSRRKGWIFLFQALIALSIFSLSQTDPKSQLTLSLAWAFCIALFSSLQDIVIDAYRRELLPDEELGLGASLYINGYRGAMWITNGLAFILAGFMPWPRVFELMALAMVPTLLVTFLAPREETHGTVPENMREAVVGPLKEFFARDGAWVMLLFILLFKVGDSFAGNMTVPFIIFKGYTDVEIGTVAKTFGMAATLIGAFLGGLLMLRMSIRSSLFFFGILQAVSTLGFALLDLLPKDVFYLAGVIGFENMASGMGTAAYAAYMASITNKKFTVTQFALLTSIMGLTSKVIPGPAGVVAAAIGWQPFFILCTLMAVPGLLLLIPLFRLADRQKA